MANFGLRDIPLERDHALKVLHQRIEQYRDAPQNERGNNLFWISQGVRPGVGYFYALTPIYVANRLQAMLGVEQTIRMESFFTPGSLPMNVTILDDNGQSLISLAGSDSNIKPDAKWMQERLWFGYTAGFRELAMKKPAAIIPEHCLFGAGGSGAGTHPDADTERRGAQSADRRPPFCPRPHV